MLIRAAQVDDLDRLSVIALTAKASWGYSQQQLAGWRAQLTPSVESLHTRPTYVADIDNVVVGFYQLHLRPQYAELAHLWTDPNHMRRGVGTALLAHAMDQLTKLGVDVLHIDSDPHAEAFYIANGAIRVGEQAAPLDGQPNRVRPQLRLDASHAISF